MIIKKYGDLTKVGHGGERVKVKCPSCGTIVILDNREYEKKAIKAHYISDYFFEIEKPVGYQIIWTCPMCDSKCYKEKHYWYFWLIWCETKVNGGYIK